MKLVYLLASLAVLLSFAVCNTLTITTVAGFTSSEGYSGDNGPATNAQLNGPRGIHVAPNGEVYIADGSNHRVRKISANGVITTVAGTGVQGFSGDNGLATSAQLDTPYNLNTSPTGELIIVDRNNHRIRSVSSAGVITTIVGSGIQGFSGDNSLATNASLNFPRFIAYTSSGDMIITDTENHRIRRVFTNGTIVTIAGTGVAGFSGDNGLATLAQLNTPRVIRVNSAGEFIFTDSLNNRIRRISTDGIITTIAGSGAANFSGDGGSPLNAQFNNPRGLTLTSSGSIIVSDRSNHRIRLIENNVVNTIAGVGTPGFSGDNGDARQAQLNFPWGVAVAPNGNIFIADRQNNRVRMLTLRSPTPTPSSASYLSQKNTIFLVCLGLLLVLM
ncbi:E3 ubiquitin-protein ligase [Acrasis kona]|uniref:E3 ubiquitin-protein ligase n=1 Tax=Acrasis kona TaxID=1008807 RepID=A0AAW2Z7P6_9EUKA